MLLFTSLILLALSSIGIIVMLGYRMWELETGRVERPSVHAKFFSWESIYMIVLKSFQSSRKGYLLIRFHGPAMAKKIHSKVIKGNPVHTHLRRAADLIKGKKVIEKKNNTGSLYIRGMLEHKEKMKNKETRL